jgi:cell division protein ZipA
MAELRWILLGVGLLVIAGIWIVSKVNAWRAARAARAAALEASGDAEIVESPVSDEGDHREWAFGPASADPPSDPDGEYADTTVLPALRADDRHSPRDPPVLVVADLPDDIEQVELAPLKASSSVPTIEPLPPPAPPTLKVSVTPPPRPAPRVPLGNAMPWPPPGRTPPTSAPATVKAEPPPAREPAAPSMPPPANDPPPEAPPERSDRLQRIVAVRLVMLSGRLASGEQLAQAFRAERLEYGRYRIFHRMGEGDRPIFSVASLVEPGSFDPDVMATERYLGVSMFAVFPGPLSAPLAFDELVATGRRLAERLGAMLQDDAGHSLTGQRLVTLREELVSFENLAQRVRPGRRD